ncbi:hypothetical protein WA026_019855 [Henosepilachna vigintioctopunctata]|uniref:Uncharacterized protein n=1 Tax=Henosepilachna vigintioctopunctata TaxID=420089 RepID=A0AAW1VCG9_9CUCU
MPELWRKRTSENDHTEENCKNQTIFIHCKGNHATTDRKCPEYKIQKEISKLMALDVLSYFEASKTIKGDNSSCTYNPLKFPPLPATSKAGDLGIILDECYRRLTLRPEHQQQSYSRNFKRNKISVEVNKKRKNTIQDSGYDKKTHEQCLIGSYGSTD